MFLNVVTSKIFETTIQNQLKLSKIVFFYNFLQKVDAWIFILSKKDKNAVFVFLFVFFYFVMNYRKKMAVIFLPNFKFARVYSELDGDDENWF